MLSAKGLKPNLDGLLEKRQGFFICSNRPIRHRGIVQTCRIAGVILSEFAVQDFAGLFVQRDGIPIYS